MGVMPLKRLLVLALLFALGLRLVPIVAPLFWPRYRQSVARLRRRADLGTAAVMIALVVSMALRGEPVWAGLVAVLSVPAVLAAVRALRS